MAELVAGERARRRSLEEQLEAVSGECARLCRLLERPPLNPHEFATTSPGLRSQIALMQKKREELQAAVGEQVARYEAVHQSLLAVARHLGEDETQFAVKDECPSEKTIKQTGEKLVQLQALLESRRARHLELLEDVRRIAEDIDFAPENLFETAVLTPNNARTADNQQQQQNQHFSNSITEQLLSELEAFRTRLVKRKALMLGEANELRQALAAQWKRLGVDEEYQRSFLESAVGYKRSAVERLREETRRLDALKLEHLSTYLNSVLREVRELANRCYLCAGDEDTLAIAAESGAVGAEGRDRDAALELLQRVETRLSELQSYYDIHRPLLEQVHSQPPCNPIQSKYIIN